MALTMTPPKTKAPKTTAQVGSSVAPPGVFTLSQLPSLFGQNPYAGLPSGPMGTPYGPTIQSANRYLYTPQQLRTIANQQTQTQINAQLAASYANQRAEQQQLQAMQNRAAGLAQALGSFGPGYAQAMQGAYDNAAQTMAAVGPGVVNQGQAAEQTNLDAAKASVAAATGGQGQVQSYDPAALAGTLETTGVQMPGNSLALSGFNAAKMGIYGAMADKAQVGSVAQYYQQQEVNALQQRAAERAQIIAQQPQLFQSALQAQRQDNQQTQARIDSLVGQAQDWISGRASARQKQIEDQYQATLGVAALQHTDPFTGKPLPGYVQTKRGIVPANVAETAAYHSGLLGVQTAKNKVMQQHYDDMKQHYTDLYTMGEDRIKAAQQKATQTGTFNKALSTALHLAVDGRGNPILINGKYVPYKPPAGASGASKPLSQKDLAAAASNLGELAYRYHDGSPATAKSLKVDPVPLDQAIKQMTARGYFSNPQVRPYAMQALSSAYGVTPAQIEQTANGIDYTTGGPLGGGSQAVPTPPGFTPPGDPRFKPGKAWDAKVDPLAGYTPWGDLRTKSGHYVHGNAQTGYTYVQ